MKKVSCPHCGKLTLAAPFCGHCGKALAKALPTPEKSAPVKEAAVGVQRELTKFKDEFGFRKRAEQVAENHKSIVIARFEPLWTRRNETDVKKERIAIQKQSRAYVLAPQREPRQLNPGVYSVANLLVDSRSPNRPEGSQGGSIVCTVSDLPITATFVLPDTEFLNQEIDPSTALNSLSLRTVDNLLGAVRFQLGMRCTDPVKLIKAFASDHLRQDRNVQENREVEISAKTVRTRPKRSTGVFGKMATWLLGDPALQEKTVVAATVEVLVEVEDFTVGDLYPRINLEMATVIRAIIRSISAEDLYNTVDARQRAEEEIQREMKQTLEAFGMKIERVSAFQFLSPDYERLLEKRAQIAVERQSLGDERDKALLRDEKRKIDEEDSKKQISSEAEQRRHLVREENTTQQLTNRIEGEQQQHDLQLDGVRRDHDRDQRGKDERLTTTIEVEREKQHFSLQQEKMRFALELQNQMHDAQLERQVKMAKAYAELPADRLLEISMAQNPQLAAAYVAAQQAKGLQQQIAMQEQFRKQVIGIYGESDERTHQLLTAFLGAKQRSLPKATTQVHPQPPAPATENADFTVNQEGVARSREEKEP